VISSDIRNWLLYQSFAVLSFACLGVYKNVFPRSTLHILEITRGTFSIMRTAFNEVRAVPRKRTQRMIWTATSVFLSQGRVSDFFRPLKCPSVITYFFGGECKSPAGMRYVSFNPRGGGNRFIPNGIHPLFHRIGQFNGSMPVHSTEHVQLFAADVPRRPPVPSIPTSVLLPLPPPFSYPASHPGRTLSRDMQ